MPTICFILRPMEQAEMFWLFYFPGHRLEITQGAKTCLNLLSAPSDIYHSVSYLGRAVCTTTGKRCESSLLTPSPWGEHHTTAHKMPLNVKGKISAIRPYRWDFAIEMTRDSLLILEGLAVAGVVIIFIFFWVNEKQQGMKECTLWDPEPSVVQRHQCCLDT